MLFSELEKYKDFPCLSCPFIRKIENNGSDFPFCSVYSAQDVVGLESCEEVFNYIEKYGSRIPKEREQVTY